ncbi:outer membrane protein assembly factor BamC [Polynucleobacter sp. MWH-Svant-W18]|jgi:outer membrane protein assembly factor BamC|uniref:outer membrane protein assembly factor BamC n=1 Tax=Polynucleobacter sp. MWH-Svant-W18 TaxID=1855909 RepID=UPI001BFE86C0|nr:outer membrane protein assembly factor BamC [Polynucleobacter sp. MWH-Svant-W18]QWD78719.1 outer membrane protein assembly factor BamC [Polynucleobacter sp. MWH-Svant-W18]
MMNLMQILRRYLAILGLMMTIVAGLTACKSVTSNDTVDYKANGAVRGPNLSYPPDLITAQADRRYIVQDGTATMSEYNAALKKSVQMRSNVMTGIPGMRIARDGERRWLVVDKPATELYPQVKDFWQENGFLLVVDSPSTGIMETDWAENRGKIPQDWLRSTIGGALDSVYDTGERDKYKTRLEAPKPNETEIYITQKGALEKCVTDTTGSCLYTIWTSRPNDPELEAVFLARLMERLGMTQEQAKAMVATPLGPKTPKAKLVEEGTNTAFIELGAGFDRSWRDVGLALDRSNFTVEDRNRSAGVYYVRYVNSKNIEESKGFFSNLFSSKDDSKLKAKKYQVVVKSTGENSASVYVQDADGKPENTPAGIQLLTLLTDQLTK